MRTSNQHRGGVRPVFQPGLMSGFEPMATTVASGLTQATGRPAAVALRDDDGGWWLVAADDPDASQVWTAKQPVEARSRWADQLEGTLQGLDETGTALGRLSNGTKTAVTPIRVDQQLVGIIATAPASSHVGSRDLAGSYAKLLGGWLDIYTRHRRAGAARRRAVDEVIHDLRGPLQAIAGASQTLQVYRGEPNVDLRLLRIISANATRMAAWLEGLLQADETAPVHGSEQTVEIDLSELMNELADNARLMLSNPDVQVTATGDGHIVAPPNTLRRLLANLASNAAQHTTSGHITLTAHPTDHTVTFTVADTGPGLPTTQHRQNRPASTGRGFGLGLRIVRRLAHRLDATVDIDTTPDVGTTITVTIPTTAGP